MILSAEARVLVEQTHVERMAAAAVEWWQSDVKDHPLAIVVGEQVLEPQPGSIAVNCYLLAQWQVERARADTWQLRWDALEAFSNSAFHKLYDRTDHRELEASRPEHCSERQSIDRDHPELVHVQYLEHLEEFQSLFAAVELSEPGVRFPLPLELSQRYTRRKSCGSFLTVTLRICWS